MIKLGLICLLFSCGPQSNPGWHVYWNGHTALPREQDAIRVVFDVGLATCPQNKWSALRAVWRGNIYFVDGPFQCGSDAKVVGCQDNNIIWISWMSTWNKTTLCDELGHVIWETCVGTGYMGSGEYYMPDGHVTYLPEFVAMVARCNTRLGLLSQ